jgi:hypothetical protein
VATRKTTREEKIASPFVYSKTQLEKPEAIEAGLKRISMLRKAMDKEHKYMNYREAFPKREYVMPVDRNEVLEEVAKEFDKMPFGDTGASISAFIRGMKR